MTRDPSRLKVYALADELVPEVYRRTQQLPVQERFGLQSQIRRAAVSIPTNLVEGCARRTTKDYVSFVTRALGSASEVRYLLSLACRLDMLRPADCEPLVARYSDLVRQLQGLQDALSPRPARGRSAEPPHRTESWTP